MRIGLWVAQLGLRGTDQFVYQLADICETILHHEVMIITHSNQIVSPDVTLESQAMFRSRFFVIFKCAHETLDDVVSRYRIDLAYLSKWGIPCDLITRRVPCVVHSIFECATPHGNCYAAISEHMKRKCHSDCEVLPFCVELLPMKKDLRHELNIPADAVVLGRHGGFKQFDIPFVQQAVVDMANKHQDVFFVFMNTMQFVSSARNIIFLPGSPDLQARSDFVHMCTGMVHGRGDGETFGLSCGEFSVANKPVITTTCGDQAHVSMLWPDIYVSSNKDEVCYNIGQVIEGRCKGRYDAYKVFNRTAIANKFEKLAQCAMHNFCQSRA